MERNNGLTIECTPTGRSGMATLTARLGDELLAVANELLRLAADLASKGHGNKPADPGGLPEIDVSRIVRPERLIVPEVSGLAVPTMTASGDKPVARWTWYLRWADGKRERRSLGPTIDLPGGGKLWVHPEPAECSPTMKRGWSADARKRWLEGEPAPDPAEVFKRLAERSSYYLDLPKATAGGTTATRLFHNMRASRETELIERFPVHVVTAWLGNTPEIARKHYLQVTDEHFRQAATACSALQPALQQPAGNPGNGQQEPIRGEMVGQDGQMQNTRPCQGLRVPATACAAVVSPYVETRNGEDRIRTCGPVARSRI